MSSCVKTRMLALLVVAATLADLHTSAINLPAGDLSARLGYVEGSREDDRIRGHLLFAHAVLAAADTSALSPALRAARANNLDRLLRYARAGQFPRNDDHPDPRRPTFVDERGEICAVGALFASDHGYPAAVRVARAFKYAFVAQIDDPALLAWQKTSGLSADELALIQPAYGWREPPDERPARLWLPWGLADRAQFGAARISLASEVSTIDAFDTTVMTLHAQAPLPRAKRTSFYLMMPMGLVLDETAPGVAAAGGTPMTDVPRRWFGNADVGVFFGSEARASSTVFRIGALVPTATERAVQAPGMRAGDAVMELPRSAGGRFAASRLAGWVTPRDDSELRVALRLDGGFDYARELDTDTTTVVPRAALGLLFAHRHATMSLDTAAAHVFDTKTGDRGLRWSTGATIRLADRHARDCGFQPALTFAAVRTPDGWGGAFALEIAMAFAQRRPYDDGHSD